MRRTANLSHVFFRFCKGFAHLSARRLSLQRKIAVNESLALSTQFVPSKLPFFCLRNEVFELHI